MLLVGFIPSSLFELPFTVFPPDRAINHLDEFFLFPSLSFSTFCFFFPSFFHLPGCRPSVVLDLTITKTPLG